jgi:hypothetical protein
MDNIKMDIKEIGCEGVNWFPFKGGELDVVRDY